VVGTPQAPGVVAGTTNAVIVRTAIASTFVEVRRFWIAAP